MRGIVILLSTLIACTPVNRTVLATSTLTIACDWGQTRSYASRGWAGGYTEANPILGETPSAGQVDLYFASAIAINAALYFVLPKSIRAVVPTGVTVRQSVSVYNNHQIKPNFCGLSGEVIPRNKETM